ncbi:Ribokinase OS=Tsukamurella paurometabola (strain ATCC 8368 / DSM / CCUG 35730 / CIP 100753 /JCM 10117 / KCTC 9821 / NBRC 16120 / NCIMB 702349 / NCTC 13040)OX=521096 GN=rbsK PE=3 SV=1 [Tsukamurella paurometabola]|uniref:Ribokinase n=1 Tax=Tsukamurella paurometabola (strain ATCC 8368 / DSM 20162 / CCUG 35730 / CIP 100753 / JCM 10117 / KCTC 9821 / NBRC 16120 / NCIMB 702349 / NCTC 13040) TaxID=521096 RepID=D5UY73_TSUPD|nr:ribokinase [Tsukamurella paurometabola]ADG78180.1 PfkB domain protein [Tsukamurella paurometabola DSM 20162]SUP30567.1 Ribokinase [Tsukamurella paurometabola]
MASVVVVGSINLDAVTVCERFPRPGETIAGVSVSFGQGGKGANQARSAARSGAETVFVGAVGDDAAAATVLGSLTAAGVDISPVRRIPGSTGFANVTVDGSGENHIIVVPGANAEVTLDDTGRAAIAAADVLLLQLEIPLRVVLDAARIARANATTVLLNPSPVQALPDELVALLDGVIVNRDEARTLAGSVRRVPHVITTLGGAGARATGPEGTVESPGLTVDVVDTTGAGDAFAGALAANWTLPPAERLLRANAAGALTATAAGAAAAPTASEVDAFLDERAAR